MPQSLSECYTPYSVRHKVATNAGKDVLVFKSAQICLILVHVFYLDMVTKSITNIIFGENRDRTIYVSILSMSQLRCDWRAVVS